VVIEVEVESNKRGRFGKRNFRKIRVYSCAPWSGTQYRAPMDNSLNAYLPVLIQAAIGVALPVLILIASHLFGQRARKNPSKGTAYECGNAAGEGVEAHPHPRFPVRFFVVALLFVLFDIEVVFLLPLALVFRELTAAGVALLLPAAFFLGVFAFGLFFEIKSGVLEWRR